MAYFFVFISSLLLCIFIFLLISFLLIICYANSVPVFTCFGVYCIDPTVKRGHELLRLVLLLFF